MRAQTDPTIASLAGDFLAYLARRRARSENTLRAYAGDLRAAAAALPGPVERISRPHIDAFLDAQAEAGLAVSTRNRRLAALRAFFTWLEQEGYRGDNPMATVEALPEDEQLPRPIPHTDRARLDRTIAAAAEPFRLILTILRETGMRASEVLGLAVGDVHLEAGFEKLVVRGAKNNRDRVVVLEPTATKRSLRGLRARLRSLQGQPASSPLFRSSRGTAIDYDTLLYRWDQICLAGGLVDDLPGGRTRRRYTLHQLRHTRATELIEQGVRLEVVQRVLGHRDPRSTQVYAELSDDLVRATLAGRR